MKIRRYLLAFYCAFSAATASADVIYRWQTSSLAPAVVSLEGTLVFSDQAYAAGELTFSQSVCYKPGTPIQIPCTVLPDSPIKSFEMEATTRSLADPMLPFAHSFMPFFPFQQTADERFSIDVSFGDVYLSGGIYADRPVAEGTISMGGSTLWTVGTLVYFNNHCYSNQTGCSGTTGYWVRVPEPPALLLLSIGLIALISTRRHRPLRT